MQIKCLTINYFQNFQSVSRRFFISLMGRDLNLQIHHISIFRVPALRHIYVLTGFRQIADSKIAIGKLAMHSNPSPATPHCFFERRYGSLQMLSPAFHKAF